MSMTRWVSASTSSASYPASFEIRMGKTIYVISAHESLDFHHS